MYSKGDFIVDLQNEEKLFELQEEMIYRGEKGLYIGRAYDLKKKRQCYLKFTDDTGKNLANLKREEKFCFFYPFIEHIYESFQGFSPDHRKIFGINAEYVQGENLCQARLKLKDEVRKGKITEDEEEEIIFRQMMQFLYGMEYYMEYATPRFLHRDLNPENIMIQKTETEKKGGPEGSGDIKIIDFDFAHISGSRQTVNSEAGLGYTIGYVSPQGAIKATLDRKSPDAIDEIYSAGRVFCFWLNASHYFPEENLGKIEEGKQSSSNESYLRNEELGYSLIADRFVPRYRDPATGTFNRKYAGLIRIIKRMCCNPAKEVPYSSPTEIIRDMQKFLLEYYGNDVELYEKQMGLQKIPLFQERMKRDNGKSVTVYHKILRPGEGKKGRALHEYAMRDIRIDGKMEMVLYNIDGKIYYIPMPGIQPLCGHNDKEYRIYDKDIFVNTEGVQIQFFM